MKQYYRAFKVQKNTMLVMETSPFQYNDKLLKKRDKQILTREYQKGEWE